MSQAFPEWAPDWLTGFLGPAPAEIDPIPLRAVQLPRLTDAEAAGHLPRDQQDSSNGDDGFTRRTKKVIVNPNQDRTVNRKLRGIHLFMITVNGTLGTGLYWRGGQILELGGPLAILLSFLLVGALAWAVMQCITEMLCIWPIPGALSVYVSEFVDVELGIAVGIAYWFTYSVSFAALIATSAAEIDFWINGNKTIDATVVYVLIPIILIVINGFEIQVYGTLEVLWGSAKILFFAVIVVAIIVINIRAGDTNEGLRGLQDWTTPIVYDREAAQNWIVALFMSLSIATYAYVGVEIVAASALEARWPNKPEDERAPTDLFRRSSEEMLIGKTVKFSAIFISVLATIAYTFSSVLASLNTSREDCQLPRLSWVQGECIPSNSTQTNGTTSSVFVAIAHQTDIPHLADIFNVFLVFTALTCANTNLYVASRSLYALTSRLDGGREQHWFLQILAWFGRTNRHKVPLRAMIFSALAFVWVPPLQLQGGNGVDTDPIGMFIEILSEMGSVGVVIVWACECWAFIRFYRCIYRHREILEAKKVSQVRRWDQENYNDYPYRSHGQPLLAYLALGSCLIVLIVANGAYLWDGFQLMPFLSSYLIVFIFVALWAFLKYVRGAEWLLVDLDNSTKVLKKIQDLHDIRLGTS